MTIINRLLPSIVVTGLSLVLTQYPASAQSPAKPTPFSPVQQTVSSRTKQTVRWEEDQAAREESRTLVHTLLQRPLTTTSAVQIALLNNRELQAAFDEIGLSAADLKEARSLSNPSLDLAVKFPNRPPSRPLYEWSFAQNFLELLTLPLRSRVAREKLTATQLRISDEVLKLVAEVKSSLIQIQSNQAVLVQLKARHEAQSASLEFMQKLHAAGNVPDLKLVQEQTAYNLSRIDIAKAEADSREAREKLNRLLGLWGPDTVWKVEAELPEIPESAPEIRALETLAVSNRLDLAASRSELESSLKALGLDKQFRFLSGLDFGLAGSHEPDGTNFIGPSIRLELPLFNQGQSRIARSEAQLRMAQNKFEHLAITIRSEVREQRDRMLSAKELSLFYRDEVIPTQKKITSLIMLNYNAMLTGAFELFAAKAEEINSQRSYIEARRDYWLARTALERAVGGDLSSSNLPSQTSVDSGANQQPHHHP